MTFKHYQWKKRHFYEKDTKEYWAYLFSMFWKFADFVFPGLQVTKRELSI